MQLMAESRENTIILAETSVLISPF